jgi:dynein heavy chain
MGKSIEYSHSMPAFAAAVLKTFDNIIVEFSDVPHVQKAVMDRLYFPVSKCVPSVDPQLPWVANLRDRIESSMSKAIEPLAVYLGFFKKYEDFINIDNLAYVKENVRVNRKDPESAEIELPVTVNLEQVTDLINRHEKQIADIEASLPVVPINCGLFSIEVVSVRELLLDKHRAIINIILEQHAGYLVEINETLEAEFKKIHERLALRPETVEQVAECEEYLTSLNMINVTLAQCIADSTAYYGMLDKYKYKIPFEQTKGKWTVYGGPAKVAHRCAEVVAQNLVIKKSFHEEMLGEQAAFLRFLAEMDIRVAELATFTDIKDVAVIAQKVKDVEGNLKIASDKAKLFNSRESLFESDITEYEDLARILRQFEPFLNLWQTAKEWTDSISKWKTGRFVELDSEEVEKSVDKFYTSVQKASKFFIKAEMKAQEGIAADILAQVNEFKPEVPLIVTLRNPGMRDRHWNTIGKEMKVVIMPIEEFTTAQVLALNLKDRIEQVQKIGESAAKEYQIEQALDKMSREWEGMYLQIHPYRETGTGVLKGVDDINVILDEHITMTQTIMFSAFKGPFEERIDEWNRKLCCVSDTLEAWVAVQRNWLYLQPIFESPDINRQLPAEGKKFSTVDKGWRQAITHAKNNAKVIEFCDNEKLLERFKESEILLDQVQKGLNDYLETKRTVFARFYFLSNDELLSILSESKDVKLVQPHLKKCFEGIDKVKFLKDLKIDRMISPEGEEVMLVDLIDPVDKNVENWMLELEEAMRVCLIHVMEVCIVDYTKTPRSRWMQKWPGMCVLNGSQFHWTTEMEQWFIKEGSKGPKFMYDAQVAQLQEMTILVRGKLSGAARTTVGALTVIDVHARDVIKKLAVAEAASANDFGWTSQLRYYFSGGILSAQMVAAKRPYGYEYLGNSFRLVITPLTDKCYLTLMGALQMIFGGAPAGPAGTGKTETTKDLAKALAMQCVVFNCSDGLDFVAMGKFFKGLCACGAWACFDEFNRINIEVLSVIGQQIMSIQMAVKAKQERLLFEGSDIAVNQKFAVFITMNPGYAGRSALPDSLQALFRPVAMMVPDYALIGEIMFFAYGFEFGKECGAKMVTTFKLCSEQLSSQPHYDYGMRAVKTTITAAGNLKRAEPDGDEMVLLLRALQDVNIPKFLEQDLKLFAGIISDLFPGKNRPELNYGALMRNMKNEIRKAGLQPKWFFIDKVIQLYEMIVVRHGLMVVGPTGGGKSSNIEILAATLGALRDEKVEGFAYEHVQIYRLNPKSITLGQMYGEVDSNTMEWKDGIMSTMYRGATVDTPERKWILFDGPVDAIWIESMNTVLDDNKKLCLLSGEIIKMSSEMTMMFEPEDLSVASPATVSRVGIIFMEPRGLGLDVLVQSWLLRMPPCTPRVVKSKLILLFDTYLQSSIFFLRTYLKELVPTVDNNLASSLMRILDCYLAPYFWKEGMDPITDLMIADMVTCIEPLFFFALTWSVGASTDGEGRSRFNAWLRSEMYANKSGWAFPKEDTVYDYLFILETKKWGKWMDIIEKYEIDIKANFSELIIPTRDSVRNTFLMDLLMPCDKHILMVGSTGTGKTINISQYLMGTAAKVQGRTIDPMVIPLTLTFSANTSANMTQDQLDSKMDKRKKGVFGPPAGKKFYIYVDDLNMPKRETYGAQPPIELLRQWFGQGGWYDRKDLGFRQLIDMVFIASMGPPGGGKQEITPRFLRMFNIIGYVEMSKSSTSRIFGLILNSFLANFEGGLVEMTDKLVHASIDVFDTIVEVLLPTPSKSHYTFNLRDLAKIFQGMLMVDARKMNSKDQLARLWVHEITRVFGDRLTCAEDHQWMKDLLKKKIEEEFNMDWDTVVPRRLLYGDFMYPEVEARIYEEIEDIGKLKTVVEEYLTDHNAESKQPMPLVMFTDALEHVTKIARVLRQPQGNALLLGVGGSGRQSMTKLATYVCGFALATVEIVKGYSMNDWRDDLKRILMQAGVKNKVTTFLFSDVQIINERMVEDINNILNAGDVPNLYGPEDLENIASACRAECTKRKIPATKINIFSQYIQRVRKNIHLCVCMSPLGEVFRNRLRNFPSLVNCCTIDWFTSWPAEALQSVGLSILQSKDLGLGRLELDTVNMFKVIHMSVEKASIDFYEVLRRRNYVTPTSYLELLTSFGKLLFKKRDEIKTKRDRLQIGLDKLSETKKVVGVMQEELVILQPVLVKTQQEVANMMVVITRDKASAAETKATVEVEEANANKKAAESKAIADSAQADLAEALPALEEAVKCLNDLKKADIDEVKSLKTPPAGVVLTIKAVCIMFAVKPIKKNDPNTPGKKIDDYWEAGKKDMLSDAKAFMESLFKFDKDNIPDKIIREIQPLIDDPGFTPAAIEKASKACTAICMWARAMHKYHFVALGVAPKRAALAEAEAELAIVMAKLAKAQATLADVNSRLAVLEKQFNDAVEKKDQLEKKEAECKMQLVNADKLIGGLGGEEKRWGETVVLLGDALVNVLGDVIVCAGTVSYLGVFTFDFRNSLVSEWQTALKSMNIPHSKVCNLETVLSDPVKLRSWQLCNLPSDTLSTQNGIIMDNSRRWSLLIDPQGQANKYIRSMAKDMTFAPNGMDTVKQSDKNFLRTLENGVQFGRWVLLENIGETLDAALEPILLQQKFKQGGQDMIKLGDNVVPYNDQFRFFLTTKLSNPHYTPEVQVKVSLVNFTITMGGLEEQLLNVVIAEEMPELSAQKANLVINNAARNKQLYDIESEILYLLANSQGNILDDTVLIETLAQSKITSEAIKAAMVEAAEIEKEIAQQSELYRPSAKRASLLYFVIADLGFVDPMYQYSLQWFTMLFIRGIQSAAPANEVGQRVLNLNDFFTNSIYVNVCRSLFERHKLLFAFILTIKILQGDDKVDPLEYRFLLSGISGGKAAKVPLPASSWLEPQTFEEICELSGLPNLSNVAKEFALNLSEWQEIFESAEPHRREFPPPANDATPLQRLCILRCLRRDKVELAMQDYVVKYLDKRFIQPPPFDLKACYADSTPITPLIFILTTGSDPGKELDILAGSMDMLDRTHRIALGQGQGKKASNLVEKSMVTGDWVVLLNCHLSVSWMPTLEMIVENMDPAKIHAEFRLWLTSMPSEAFPRSVLQSGLKITKEPPKGIRANLLSTYLKLNNSSIRQTSKPDEYMKLLFGLAFFHAIVVERKKYGPMGWNIPYEFNDTDKDITAAQLALYVEQYEQVPYKVLQQLASVVNYGGRITDDKDMRTSDIIIADFFDPKVLKEGHKFSASGIYKVISADKDTPHDSYMAYIESLPLNAEPEVFGMHDNANITSAISNTNETFEIILTLQPRVATGAGASREDQISEVATRFYSELPRVFDLEAVGMQYPTDYYESMNTVLIQEAERYNNLLVVLLQSLHLLPLALKGLVVLSAELEAMGTAVFDQRVPDNWTAKAYPSLKPLNAWFKDLLERLKFMNDWVDTGVPQAFWISGFFFPQGFLTACLQNFARKQAFPIDTVAFSFVLMDEEPKDLVKKPEDGCYIYGMFLEGSRYDKEQKTLVDPRPKELFSIMPPIHMLPVQHRADPMEGIYRCPLYKVLTRTGTLSTTGHSTNFVTWLELPSNRETIFRSTLVSETNRQGVFCDNADWVRGGVAAFCALRF